MALIINADDLGISENVNRAICEAFEKGLIDRTTLMANMPFAEDGMKLAQEKGFIDRVGLHLNLTSGMPLTEGISADTVMCDGNGEFTADFARNLRTRFFLPKKTRENVEKEIRAQLDRYRELGGTLWHIDSHHHVHTDASVWRILKRVFRDYPVTGVRLSRNMYDGGNPLIRLYKFFLNGSIRKHCKSLPEYFGSAADYEEYSRRHEGLLKDHNVEIMVHPIYDADGKLADVYKGDFRELKRPLQE